MKKDGGGLLVSILEVNTAIHTISYEIMIVITQCFSGFLECLPFFILGQRSIGVGKRYH